MEALAGAGKLGPWPRFDVFAILDQARKLGGDGPDARHRNLRAAILHHAIAAAPDLTEARRFADGLIELFEHYQLLKPVERITPEAAEAPGLTEQENRILRCLLRGLPNKAIASEVGVTESTVKVHLKSILKKLKLQNRTQAALWADRNGYGAASDLGVTEGETDGKET